MEHLDIEKIVERSQIGIQAIAVCLLGWLATSISSLDSEIKELNAKMIAVVEITRFHEARLSKVEESDREHQLRLQRLQIDIRDRIDKLRDKQNLGH